MERKGKTLTVWLCCLVLAALPAFWMPVTSLAAKNQDSGGKMERRGHGFAHVFKKLGLSEDQKHQVAVILKGKRDQRNQLVNQMIDARKNYRTTIGAPNFNEADVRKAAQAVTRVQEDLMVLRAQTRHEIRAVLTPEQQQKMDAMREKFGNRMRDRIDSRFERMDSWIDKHAS